MKKRSAEDILRASLDPEPAEGRPGSPSPPTVGPEGATGSVGGLNVAAPLDDLGFAAASGAASGAYRVIDLLSIGVHGPGGYDGSVAKARQLLAVALWQLNGADAIRRKRAAEPKAP